MPYILVRKGNGYVVRNKITGREYSSHPISKMKAEAQLRVLRQVEKESGK